MITASITLTILTEQGLNVFGILAYTLTIAVVTINENHKMAGVKCHLCALIIASGCANPTLSIAIDRKSVNIDESATDAFVRFALASNTQCKCIAHKTVGIKTTNAVAISNRCEVDQIYQRILLIEFLALQHPAYQGFRCRTITRGILTAGFIHTACC